MPVRADGSLLHIVGPEPDLVVVAGSVAVLEAVEDRRGRVRHEEVHGPAADLDRHIPVRLRRHAHLLQLGCGIPGARRRGGGVVRQQSTGHVLPQEVLEGADRGLVDRVLRVDDHAVLAREEPETAGVIGSTHAAAVVQIQAAGHAGVHGCDGTVTRRSPPTSLATSRSRSCAKSSKPSPTPGQYRVQGHQRHRRRLLPSHRAPLGDAAEQIRPHRRHRRLVQRLRHRAVPLPRPADPAVPGPRRDVRVLPLRHQADRRHRGSAGARHVRRNTCGDEGIRGARTAMGMPCTSGSAAAPRTTPRPTTP